MKNRLPQLTSLTVLLFLLMACAATPDPRAAHVFIELAAERDSVGDHERAVSYYRAAVEADPRNVITRHALARAYLAAHEYDLADDQFNKIVEIYEERPERRGCSDSSGADDYAAACAYLMTGRAGDADKLLTGSILLHPDDVPLLQARAIALFRLKRFGAAAELLIRARNDAAKRNHTDGFVLSRDSGGMAEENKGFPHAVVPQLMMMVVRQLFKERFEEGSAGGAEDASEAKAVAQTAVTCFPEWGFAHTACAGVLDPGTDIAAISEHHRRALELSPWDPDVVRRARLFFVRLEEYAAALAAWQRTVPMAMLRSKENTLRDRISQLESATAAAEKVKDAATLPVLARAYDAMGWTEEALAVARRFEASYSQDEGARGLRESLAAHADFIKRLRTYAKKAYMGRLDGGSLPDAKEVVKFAEEAGTKSGAVRFDTDEEMESFLFAGSETFSLSHPDSRLTRYLLSHGQIFTATEGWGPPMINLMNVLYWALDERAVPGREGKRFKYNWVVGDEVRIWSYIEFLADGPRIAGLTGIGAAGFVIDVEALRPRDSGELYPSHAAGPAPEAGRTIQAQASRVLMDRFLQEVCGETGAGKQERFEKVLAARIDRVAAHEFGHIVDLRDHLPLLAHLPANLGIAIGNRLSPDRIRARGEMVAEAMSLALAAAPRLVVQDNISWAGNEQDIPYWYMLVRPRESVEADSPYTEAARALLSEILDRAEATLQAGDVLQAGVPVVLQLDKLSAEDLRAIGAAISSAGE